MTYYKREWTAFTEADLLAAGSDNGTSLGHGDTFTMPGSATVTMSTWDNDYAMSGDNYSNDRSNDQYGQDAYVDGHYLGAKLYAESYHVLHGSDGKTYYLIEIEVEGYNAPGVGDDFFAFYGSVPPAGVELSVGGQCNVTGCWVDYKCLSAGDTAPANTPPTFTNLPSDGIICIDENTTFVIDVNAQDADGDALTYEIVGGRDADFFEIDAHTGELKFIGAPDYENPISGGHSNTYDVTIKVSDGNGGHETKALWVKVKDVEENGVIKGRFTHDADGNDNEWNEETHQWDEGIEGATIQLLDLHGTVVATAVTDHYGNYSFDVPPGDYQVKFPTVEGKIFSEQDSANAAEHYDSDADENGLTNVIHLTDGGMICDVDTGVKEKPVVGDCIVIEAEDMHEWGFQTAHGSNASGGEFVKLNCTWGNGELSTTFNGESGEYDIKIHAQDESDGQSSIWVQVNGHTVDCIVLNRDSDGHGSDHGYFSEFTLENINLNAGDTLSLYVQGRHGEWVRIDKIELCKDGEKCPDGFSLEDFSGPAKGTVVGTQFDGFSVVAQRAGDHPNSENDAMIFDSAHPTGGDHDLEYANLGNILIISEDNDSSDPDDNAHGGSITFDFDNPSDVHDIKLLDIEEAGGTIDLFDADGTLIKSVAIPAAGDNSIQTIKLDAVDVASMVINLVGSGAVDDLCFKPGEPPALGSLSGRYFCDDDSDGTELNGTGLDVGVAGFTVVLLDGAGTPLLDANGAQITTTTGSDGSYSFTDLAAGDYGVQFVGTPPFKQFIAPDQGGDDSVDSDAIADGNGNATILGITVEPGQDTADNDAGVADPATSIIRGTVFMDNNDNNVNDTGDMGLEGVTVTLSNGDTTTTDANGNYEFTGLTAGDYVVTFPAEIDGKELVESNFGLDDTIDSDAVDNLDGTASTGTITLGINDVSENNDAGVEDPGTASVGDTVFVDANGNGVRDGGEVGLDGVDVTLTGAGADGVFGTGDDTSETVTTAGGGQYAFTDLDAGDYKVTFDEATAGGLVFTTEGVDADDATNDDSDAGAGGMTDVFTLDIGEAETDIDAGLVDPETSVIEGVVFCDENDDDLDNDGAPVGGVTVNLLNADGSPTGQSTTTAIDGSYSFAGLAAGSYIVEFDETTAGGKELVGKDANANGNDDIDSDADQDTGRTDPITVGVAETVSDIDAGVEDPGTASVGDFVFLDANGNGIQDMGEAGIQGVNVTLTGAGADGVFGTGDDTSETQTTGANGEYLFDDLLAGTYKATFDTVTSAGLVLTAAGATSAAGDDGADDSDADTTNGMTSAFELSIGEAELDIDAGYVDPATSSIGDKVFLDGNGNGIQDLGEAGVAGVDVTLIGAGADGVLGTGDDTSETQTTGANGEYLFDGLTAGEYVIEFDIDDVAFDFTDPDQGMDDALDSDADVTTGRTGTITLGIDEQNITVDAGVVVANNDPRAFDDQGKTCADETITIDVRSNDLDQDDDPLTVTQVGGLSIIEGQPPISIDGVDSNGNAYTGLSVALVGGSLVFDGEAAFAALDIGEEASVTLSYTVDDGFGGTDQANVTVTFCGDANSVDSLVGSLPGSISYQVSDGFAANPVGDFGYDMQIVDAGGDARLEGVIFESAYCLDFARSVQTGADFTNAPVLTGDLSLFDDTSAASVLEASQNGVNGSALANVNELNWILNQDFENDGTGSVDGTFTGWEVQFAIWELTNNFPSAAALAGTPSIGQIEDVDYIVDRAIAEGFDFVAGVGDIVGVVVDPNPATSSNDQPFLIGLQFEDYDCLC